MFASKLVCAMLAAVALADSTAMQLTFYSSNATSTCSNNNPSKGIDVQISQIGETTTSCVNLNNIQSKGGCPHLEPGSICALTYTASNADTYEDTITYDQILYSQPGSKQYIVGELSLQLYDSYDCVSSVPIGLWDCTTTSSVCEKTSFGIKSFKVGNATTGTGNIPQGKCFLNGVEPSTSAAAAAIAQSVLGLEFVVALLSAGAFMFLF